MSRLEDFNLKQEAILAIPNENVKEPVIPMSAYNQEADDLYSWALEDKEQLATIGITEEKIVDLLPRVGACRHAQAEWMTEYETAKQAEKQWKVVSPAAYDLRDELLHAFRYAFRNYEELLTSVDNIAEGSSHADMIQDLYDLSILGKQNLLLLASIGVDMAKLELAATKSEELASIRSLANGARISDNEKKELRDRAYTYLKELVDEIRSAGKYLFWKDDERFRGYTSLYRKKHRKSTEVSE